MSDVRLNDKSVASDAAYIYAETASGEQIRISKADLATVVAERIGVKYKTVNLGSGEETTFDTSYGLIVMSSNSTGQTAVYAKSNSNLTQLHVSSESFGSSFEVSYMNSNSIKVKNVHSTNRSIEIMSLASFGKVH